MSTSSEPDPEVALRAVVGRRSISKLTEPGPSHPELEAMLAVAATAPDHARLRPWRFVVLEGEALAELGEAYARALVARDPQASDEQLERARGKPQRSPTLVAVIARLTSHETVRDWEQLAATGAAAHNLCIAATAYGYGSMWRTGWYAEHPLVLAHLGVDAGERLVALIHLGTPVEGYTPRPREGTLPPVSWRG
ncbi:MAG: nitroreductase [Nitriliruptoraceae bacterium]